MFDRVFSLSRWMLQKSKWAVMPTREWERERITLTFSLVSSFLFSLQDHRAPIIVVKYFHSAPDVDMFVSVDCVLATLWHWLSPFSNWKLAKSIAREKQQSLFLSNAFPLIENNARLKYSFEYWKSAKIKREKKSILLIDWSICAEEWWRYCIGKVRRSNKNKNSQARWNKSIR